jgi:hypothetical protein
VNINAFFMKDSTANSFYKAAQSSLSSRNMTKLYKALVRVSPLASEFSLVLLNYVKIIFCKTAATI